MNIEWNNNNMKPRVKEFSNKMNAQNGGKENVAHKAIIVAPEFLKKTLKTSGSFNFAWFVEKHMLSNDFLLKYLK